jgi:large subunit ribosomal protein L17
MALLRGLVTSFMLHGYVNTTMARAKAVQRMAERLITRAKRGTVQDLREITKVVYGKDALKHLVDRIVPLVGSRASGYTTITKLAYRRGDASLLVRLAVTGWQFEGRPESGEGGETKAKGKPKAKKAGKETEKAEAAKAKEASQ